MRPTSTDTAPPCSSNEIAKESRTPSSGRGIVPSIRRLLPSIEGVNTEVPEMVSNRSAVPTLSHAYNSGEFPSSVTSDLCGADSAAGVVLEMTRARAKTSTVPTAVTGREDDGSLKNGYLEDFISGIAVPIGPEEVEAVQVFSHQLVEDFGYPKERIQTRPQFRTRSNPSSSGKKYPIDIAIFSDDDHTDDTLDIVVECKRKNRKDGQKQLQTYLDLSHATLGVCFNGEERLCLRKVTTSKGYTYVEIPTIPKFGQTLAEVGQLTVADLEDPHNLKADFRAVRNHLAGNTVGATDDKALAGQLINIVFCKIFDERVKGKGELLDFRTGIEEVPADVAARIRALFKDVKNKYKDVISAGDAIDLDDKSIAYVVAQIQNYRLLRADRDVIADAFETFVGHALKGESGQFFTPRNVVKLLVQLADPRPDKTIIDPACGSGGFLVEVLDHVWSYQAREAAENNIGDVALREDQLEYAKNNICGIEKDAFLSKVTKSYMALMGDGRGGVFCEDSLDKPESWKPETRGRVALGSFDFVFANPPFGKDIKVTGEEQLVQFGLSHAWKLDPKSGTYLKVVSQKDDQNPQILFVERCLQLLNDGGHLGIILPETYFHAPSTAYVMDYLVRGNNIKWIVDLPHNTFRPHCNAKCIAIVLQKGREQEGKINMAVAHEMGHDHQGKPKFRWDPTTSKVDTDCLWDDIREISVAISPPSSRVHFEWV
jgi:type I restriction enzyme M protein